MNPPSNDYFFRQLASEQSVYQEQMPPDWLQVRSPGLQVLRCFSADGLPQCASIISNSDLLDSRISTSILGSMRERFSVFRLELGSFVGFHLYAGKVVVADHSFYGLV